MKRATSSILLGCSLLSGFACDKGAVTLVTPNSGFPGRSVDVQISGFGTAFSPTSSVELSDPGVKAGNIGHGSDGNLRATLTIDAAARLGDYDVTVRTGGDSLVLSKGFKVGPSLKSDVMNAAVQQGSVFAYAFLNLDYVTNPLDQFARLNSGLNSIPGTNNVTGSRMSGMALADVMASGPVAVQAISLSPLEQYMIFASDAADPQAPNVSARSATQLAPGTPLPNQSHVTPRSNNLYQFTTSAADQVALVQFTALGAAFVGNGATSLQGAFAPADGRWAGGQFADTTSDGMPAPTRTMLAFLPAAGTSYLATWPTSFGGSTNHTYTVGLTLLSGTRVSIVEPATRDSGAAPLLTIASLSSTAPQLATDGQIEDGQDSDYVRYTAAPGTTRVYAQVLGPGATASISEYATSDCSGMSTANANASNVATLEVAAAPGVPHCIRLRAGNGATYPFPYRVIIAAR